MTSDNYADPKARESKRRDAKFQACDKGQKTAPKALPVESQAKGLRAKLSQQVKELEQLNVCGNHIFLPGVNYHCLEHP